MRGLMKRIYIALLFFLPVLLTSCALSPVELPEITRYTLDPVLPAIHRHRQDRASLLVSMPKAQPGYNTHRMLYSLNGNDLRYYAKHEWVSAPNKMLQPLLVQALTNNGAFRSVIAAPFAGMTSLRLDTTVLYWVQRFDGRHNRVQIALRVRLVKPSRGRVIKSQTFIVTEPVRHLDPAASVDAINRAVRRLLRDIVRFCGLR